MKIKVLSLLPMVAALLFSISVQAQTAKPGTTTTHGFRYINHTNKGGRQAKPGDAILVNTMTWIGDSLMASTAASGGPREYTLFQPDQLPKRVPALYDAALLMGEGDSISVFEKIDTFLQKFIPPSLASATEVRYDVVLLKITTAEDKQKAQAEAAGRYEKVAAEASKVIKEYGEGKLNGKLTTTATGLKALILDPGQGAPVKKGEQVQTNYYGAFLDGKMFDNSFERGEPLAFGAGIGQMIPGFDEGVQLLHHGGRAYFFLPYQLAYGEEGGGPIPPKSDLVFYVELL